MTLHKQHLIKFGLTAISALILTACGSSGGSSASSSSNTTPANQVEQPAKPKAEVKPAQPAQPKAETKPAQPAQPKVEAKPEQPAQPKVEAKPEQPAQPKVENKLEQPAQPKVENKLEQPAEQANVSTGKYITVGGYGEPIESKAFTGYATDKIIINGTELALTPEGENHQTAWNIASDGNGKEIISCCHPFSDMRVGVINDLRENSKTLFYNGKPTLDMPKGSASYTGVAIFDGYVFKDETLQRSTSSFNVDFDNKNLDGHLVAILKDNQSKTIDILAKIEGNAFKGNAVENNGTLKGEIEGKFFGEQARELGGVVKGTVLPTENGWGAVFGAQKQ